MCRRSEDRNQGTFLNNTGKRCVITYHTITGSLCVCLSIIVGCTNKDESVKPSKGVSVFVAQKKPRISWDSGRMLEVERTCKELSAPVEIKRQRRGYDWTVQQLAQILTRDLSQEELRELAASCSTMPLDEKERCAFANFLLQAIVVACLDSGDRETLVILLSTRCPERVLLGNEIEFYLAWQGSKLRDPILVLYEADARCKCLAVRSVLSAAYRRAFTGVGICRAKDDAFMRAAYDWYMEHAGKITLNLEYSENMEEQAEYETNPLFLLTPSDQE